jgi:energy-coupling factor transporter ATP-binding protein EcfA2
MVQSGFGTTKNNAMSTPKNTYQATKTRTNRPGWSVIFRHPKRTDSRGKFGLKVRRGLNTTDDAEADRLVSQLNELLGDQRWWSADRRKEAGAHFEELVVSIFFDGMEAGKVSSAEHREARIPLPTAKDGFSRILFTGTTGAGKTTLLRHIIGSNHTTDRFPSTSTSRTTTAEIEIVTADGDFEGVVTFMPEHEVRAHIDECLEDACLSAVQGQAEAKTMAALLTHREQRFRLSYILGGWEEKAGEDANDFSFEDDNGNEDDLAEQEGVGLEEKAKNKAQLDAVLERIKSITASTNDAISADFGTLSEQEDPDNRASWLELYGDLLYEQEEFGRLALDLMEAVEDRFKNIHSGTFENGPTGWPVVWSIVSDDRNEFLRHIRWFASNHHQQFGQLLTPLVDGIRIRGPLYPDITDLEFTPKLVLLDGEGIGHTAKSASSISTRVTRRFAETDLILIVDNAEQPMQSAPLELLRVIGNSGNADKLAVAFTHFDQVKGRNFGNFEQKREHVLNSVRDAIGSLRQAVGAPVAAMLENRMDSHAFFLGGLDRDISKIPTGFRAQLSDLLHVMQKAAETPPPPKTAPIYTPEGLEIALRDAIEGFQEPWKARLGLQYRDGIEKEHWTRIKALTRRLANAWGNEYDNLRPVADLVGLLQENISKWLASPTSWTVPPKDDEERNAALSDIRKAVFNALLELAEERVAESHRSDWSRAFDYSGTGSGYRRAEQIDRIYEEAAPLIHVGMTAPAREFLKRLHQLVSDAVVSAGGQFIAPIPVA